MRSDCILIIIGQFSNLIFAQCQSADNLGDPLLQFRAILRLFVAGRRQPVIDRKKVTLEKGTFQRICDCPFRMLFLKLIE